MGEHRLYKPRVTGSSPVPPTRIDEGKRQKEKVKTFRAILTFTFLLLTCFVGVVVQLVRTPACHAGGREFESRRPRHILGSFEFRVPLVTRNPKLETGERWQPIS